MLNFLRVAAVTPEIRVADCKFNAARIIEAITKAASENVRLVCMPELCVTGYTCGDLFLQKTLIDNAWDALNLIVSKTFECNIVAVIGLPIPVCDKLYNVAAVISGGEILGIVPKSFISNYGGTDQLRHFAPARNYGTVTGEDFCYWNSIPFGADLIFHCKDMPEFRFSVEIGDDLLAANPPSVSHAAAGATIIVNTSANCETAGQAEKRRSLVTGQSARLLCGYICANAGHGESTTDMVFSAHNLICECGEILSESPPFGDGWAVSDIDLHAISYNRRRKNEFPLTPHQAKSNIHAYSLFSLNTPSENKSLLRHISPTPFLPKNENEIPARCDEILNIQSHGLAKRLGHIGAKAVLGISGGLDSTLALLVTLRAYELLGLAKSDIIAVTMPCFGTTERTKSNAHKLCAALGIPIREIDITESVRLHLRDINHPENQQDATYENAQARIRTLVLMNLANQNNGIVIGSGNLSELALGWATYNGDHMSMYGVNAGVPKTLVRHIIKHAANFANSTPELKQVLEDIVNTPISPELLPPKNGEITQQTENIVGPYELHDFFIYHTLRYGRTAEQTLELAKIAFSGNYPTEDIKKRLHEFCNRFFSQQFKRNCLPDSPKIGSISLSPRDDWRMPSDSENFFRV